ncbi:MAG: glycoside-pentoside-hexuronide (GPH):cation symporter [Pseudonocardia sp.]|nr:glycoside-pentoside-hexuronide (GPH):cation symporter [Pseudonocardia sp.]
MTTNAPAASTTTPLRMPQYLGYAAGDAANNLAFSMTSFFLLLYYTDVVGIAAAAAGTLFLVVRIFDAFADVFAGRMVDRTMTRWGKFRPFFMFGAVPLMLLSVATFTLPGLASGGWALVLAYLTYGALGLAYSLVNIPYGSLAAAMTQQAVERGKLASFRMIGVAATIIMLAFVVAPQIRLFADDPAGLQQSLLVTTLIFAVVGTALYLYLFRTAKEQVEREVPHVSMRQSLRTLRSNRPLVMLCLSSLAFLCGMFTLQTVQAFYAKDVLGNANFIILLTILSAGAIFVVAPAIPTIVRKVGKKPGFIAFGVVGIVAGIGISLAPASIPAVSMVFFGLMGVSIAGVNTLMWALEADTVEYGEWKTGVRTEGITYAMFSFTRKVGQAIGGAAAAYAIGFGGYVASAPQQSGTALAWISAPAGFLPAAFLLIGVAIFLGYPLTDQKFTELVAQTRARREAAHAAGRTDTGAGA